MEKQYIAYYRVSSKGQKKSGLGLESQKDIISYYAQIDGKVTKSFREAHSGSDKTLHKREKLKEAMEYVLEDKNRYLIIAKYDRLTRSVKDALEIFEELEGRIVWADIPNPDKFTITIFYAIAERELELGSMRTKAALRRKLQRGKNVKITKDGREAICGALFHKKPLDYTKITKASNEGNSSKWRERNKYIIDLCVTFKKQGMTHTEIAKTLSTMQDKNLEAGKFKTKKTKNKKHYHKEYAVTQISRYLTYAKKYDEQDRLDGVK